MQRYFTKERENDLFKLSLDDTYHITKVMRMGIGDIIEVVYQERLYKARIETLSPVTALIIEELDTYNEMDIKVTIAQSLVKENKMDLILQKGVELGAYSFIPLKTYNSIIKIDNKDALKKVTRWQKIVKEASEQSKRNIIPKVLPVMDLRELGALEFDLKILCTVNELTKSLKKVLQNKKKYDTIIIVVGPEGGFKREEETYLLSKGFISTSLGKRVLRTETASIVALSMINYEYER